MSSCLDPWAPSPPHHQGLNLPTSVTETVLLKTWGQRVACQRDTVRPQILKFTLEQPDKVISCLQSNNNNFRFCIFPFTVFFFFLLHAAYAFFVQLVGFQVPNQGLNAHPWQSDCSPNHWTAGGFHIFLKVNHYYILQVTEPHWIGGNLKNKTGLPPQIF